MARLTVAICGWWLGMVGAVAAQSPAGIAAQIEVKSPLVKTVAAPPKSMEVLPPPAATEPTPAARPFAAVAPAAAFPMAGSPGEGPMSREARAHEQYLLMSQAQAESIRRAAVARAEQRTRRLESQRWFGISNSRPTASIDPYDGDYSPTWVSNYPFHPYRWVGAGEPWGFVEAQ